MKKYTIDLNSLASNADPIDYLCKLFGFRSSKNNSLKSLYRSLLNNSEDMYIEFQQYDLLSDSIMSIIKCFEDIQDKTSHLHLTRSLG